MEESHRYWPCPCRVSSFAYVQLHPLTILSDGKKMSKSLRNFPDPNLILDRFGADATRSVLRYFFFLARLR